MQGFSLVIKLDVLSHEKSGENTYMYHKKSIGRYPGVGIKKKKVGLTKYKMCNSLLLVLSPTLYKVSYICTFVEISIIMIYY